MAWHLEEALQALSRRDRRMACAIAEIGNLHRSPVPGLFPGLAQSIVGQQISMKAADAVWQRLERLTGGVTPGSIAALEEDELRSCGISGRKAQYLRQIARAFLSGDIGEQRLLNAPDEEVIATLTQLPGVGRWTAEMLLIFTLERPNVMSYGDFGLRKGLCMLYHHREMTRERFSRYARRFSPYGTAASLILWEIAAGRAPESCKWKKDAT